MNEWKRVNSCTAFWWVAAAGLSIGAYVAVPGALGVFLGILILAGVGLGGSVFFCAGTGAGVTSARSFTAPAVGSDTPAIAAAAARAAIHNVTQHGPPSAQATGAAPPAAPPAKASGAAKPKAAPKSADKAPKGADTAPEAVAVEGSRPEALSAPRNGKPDNLKEIKGIGPKLEQLCHEMGFYHFDQIAAWSEAEVAWVDQNLEGFKGRVSRDNWIQQAKILADGGETAFSKRVEDGDVY